MRKASSLIICDEAISQFFAGTNVASFRLCMYLPEAVPVTQPLFVRLGMAE